MVSGQLVVAPKHKRFLQLKINNFLSYKSEMPGNRGLLPCHKEHYE